MTLPRTIPDPAKMDPQVIDIRAVSGGIEDTYPVTLIEESSPPLGIDADVVKMSLGTETAPGTWLDPDVDIRGANQCGTDAGVLNTRTVQLTIGGTYTPSQAQYWLWTQIADGTEVIVRRHFRVKVLAD